jgi:tetratricopeptide (TPR) repeat protein
LVTKSEFNHDVFISYSHRDKAWVQDWLLPRLRAADLRVCIDFDCFELGAPVLTEIERAVQTSRKTLVVLTPDYLGSAWGELENILVSTLDPAARERRLLPLMLEPCDLPLRLRALIYLDFTEPPSREAGLRRLLAGLGAPSLDLDDLPLDTIPDPAPLPPGSRMPLSHNPLFVGREADLRTLAEVLKVGDTAAIGQIAAATGMGGIGKTQLAAEFVHRYGQYFPGGVFWLSFADPAAVPAEVAACGDLDALDLRPEFQDLPLDDQVRLVLAAWGGPEARLLVFDNCEDEALLAGWRPRAGGWRVLVTSRRAIWDATLGVEPLALGVLSREESIALLGKHHPDFAEDDAHLDAIASEVGDLPLALHLAGSFLASYRHVVKSADYLAALGDQTLLDHPSLQGRGAFLSPTDHELHVARTFALSYDRLDGANPTDALALAILARVAHFAPGEPIPRALLLETLDLGEGDLEAALQAEDALARLVELGLLEGEAEGGLRLHRLLASFVRGLVSDDQGAQLAVERALLAELSRRSDQLGYLGQLPTLRVHLRAVTDAAQTREDEQAATLCSRLGYYLREVGDYAGARPYYERALAIREKVLGPDHPDTAHSLCILGLLLQDQGDYQTQTARPYFERALRIQEEVLGPDHPHTALSLNNLALLLRAQGDYEVARAYAERALAIYEKVLGPDHPETATSLSTLGLLLQDLGDYEAAQSYLERALAIQEEVLGPDHPVTAICLNQLAWLLKAQGDYEAARPYAERALAIFEAVKGPDHRHTASSLDILATLLKAQGDFEAARPYAERALAIRESVLGPDHPHTRTVRDNLASLNAGSA